MRIIRTYDPDGVIVHARLLDDGRAEELSGMPSAPRPSGRVFPCGELLAPIEPPLVLAIAQNYRAHAAEMQGC